MDEISISECFCGPPGSGNGGYVAGRLAGFLGRSAAVTLRRPVPLGRPLSVVRERDAIELRDGVDLLARAEPATLEPIAPGPLSLAEARLASSRFPRAVEHPLPGCFVCGTGRAPGDGLRIFPGPLDRDPRIVAAPWKPGLSLAGEEGFVRDEFLWAALDCAGAFATNEPPRGLMLLGRLQASVMGRLAAGEESVVVGWPIADHGRRVLAGTALYAVDPEKPNGDSAARLVALARATWVFVEGPDGPARWRNDVPLG